jgi:cyclohexanecarboxylate-CoA ligase
MGDPLHETTTIWGLVEHRATLTPDAPMLVDAADRAVTFGEFRRRAERLAGVLHAMGVADGTPVTWQLPSTIDAIVLSAALARLGALQNPILHIYREREVAVALRGVRPRLFVHPGTWRGTDFGAQASAAIESAGLDHPPELADLADLANLAGLAAPAGGGTASGPPPPTPVPGRGAGDDPVRWLYFTSGTTSEPKGVRHTDGTLLAGGRGLALALRLAPEDVGSIAFPFAHIAGPDYLVSMLVNGFSAVVLEAFDPAVAVEVFNRHRVTVAGGSTAFYQALLNEQRKQPGKPLLPTLRILAGGGAPKPPEIFHAARRELGVTIFHGYGMTEVPMITQGATGDDDEQLVNTEGAPVSGAEVRVVSAAGEPLPPGEDGEVRVRGPMVCKGYEDAALTAAAFDAEGWFRTGDIGHLREDGHLVLTGRLKDVIIRKGENISAREVEELLYGHPKVGDVAVIGLPDPDRGERVCAVVEPAPGAGRMDFDEMAGYLRSCGLMMQKIPEQLEVVEELPRAETLRKVLKYKLREQLAGKPWPTERSR